MVGVGAIAGTLSGGYTNAARSPDGSTGVAVDHAPVVARVVSVAPAEPSAGTTTVAMTMMAAAQAAPAPAADEPAPTAVIAARFPSNWQQAARPSSGDNDPPPMNSTMNSTMTMAYAAEPQRAAAQQVEPVRPAAASASSGFQLASVDPSPEPAAMPKRMAKPAPPKPAVLFNDAQLASIKARLRLTANQEAYWPQVEQALRAISWKIATQSKGIVTGKQQAQMIDPNSPEVAKLKSAAFPLIMSMREEQKQEVRQLAHTMGLKQVATMF
jgi:hypothetical protein